MSPEPASSLLLASRSHRRYELLGLLGLPFDVAIARVPEVARPGERPGALVARLSQLKARAVRDARERGTGAGGPCEIIVACDTIVALDGDILGKPRDADGATTMLLRLHGRSHIVYSAITLLSSATGRTLTDIAQSRVTMRRYTGDEIAAYVASGDPLDKAGAYAIQNADFHPVAALHGCYASVMGLPLCHLTRCLRAWGMEPPCDVPAVCQRHTGYVCEVYAAILAGQPGSSPL